MQLYVKWPRAFYLKWIKVLYKFFLLLSFRSFSVYGKNCFKVCWMSVLVHAKCTNLSSLVLVHTAEDTTAVCDVARVG